MKVLYLENDTLYILDQTLLPGEERYIEVHDVDTLFEAIKSLKVRGAPLIGIAAAYGVYVESLKHTGSTDFKEKVLGAIEKLRKARPTAYNLMRALDRMKDIIKRVDTEISSRLLEEARSIEREEVESCEKMGNFGASLFKKPQRVLTICNTGTLATGGIGTALGVIRKLRERGLLRTLYVMETRPLLQGARLTMWELMKDKIDAYLINDSLAPYLIKIGKIDVVFTGADRIAMNGDTANKVGTLSIAIAAKRYGIPFYIVAPLSTFDPNARSGKDIIVEERSEDEITHCYRERVAPSGVRALNYAFDITERELISGYITEVGIIDPPFYRYFPMQK